jgi:hypothetical protein
MAPNFPPGTPNTVNPAVTPTWCFTPTPNVTGPSVRIYNPGRNIVYVGGSQVTQNNGLPIPPGNKPIELQNCPFTVYALSGVSVGTAAGTLSASAVTVGTTAITLTTTVPTSLAAGTTIIVGSTAGTGWEAQVVNTTTASSQLTFLNPLVQDHVGGSIVYTATANPGQVVVSAGVL